MLVIVLTILGWKLKMLQWKHIDGAVHFYHDMPMEYSENMDLFRKDVSFMLQSFDAR